LDLPALLEVFDNSVIDWEDIWKIWYVSCFCTTRCKIIVRYKFWFIYCIQWYVFNSAKNVTHRIVSNIWTMDEIGQSWVSFSN
jgi:hypothetical protein